MFEPTIFSVVTQHLDPVAKGDGDFDKRVTVAAEFDRFTDAHRYAKSINFETDGSMFPNVDIDDFGGEFGVYEAGVFLRGNRYAAIFRDGPYID
mgnify:CR=1 FL=1